MKFSVLGAGRWGSFIAWYLDKIGNKVTLWGKPNGEKIQKLIESRQNEYVSIPESITISTNLEETILNPMNKVLCSCYCLFGIALRVLWGTCMRGHICQVKKTLDLGLISCPKDPLI